MATARALYNSSGMKMASEMAAQASQLLTMPKITGINNIMVTTDAFNIPAARMASEMAAQANSIKAMCKMPAIESMPATADTLNSYGKLFSDEMEENYSRISEDLEAARLIENAKEKKGVNADVPTDENP